MVEGATTSRVKGLPENNEGIMLYIPRHIIMLCSGVGRHLILGGRIFFFGDITCQFLNAYSTV